MQKGQCLVNWKWEIQINNGMVLVREYLPILCLHVKFEKVSFTQVGLNFFITDV